MASMNEWKTSVSRLEECFNILFPRFSDSIANEVAVTVPVTAAAAVEDVEAGQDDVNWEDEDAEEDPATDSFLSEEVEQHDTTVGAPYTLNIRLATTAADIETRDNAILVHHIREISRQLARITVPKLLAWQDLFAQTAVIYSERCNPLRPVQTDGEGASAGLSEIAAQAAGASSSRVSDTVLSSLGKRSADVLSGSPEPSARASDVTVSPHSSAELEKWEAEVCSVEMQLADMAALLGEIRSLLTGKCKTLLQNEAL